MTQGIAFQTRARTIDHLGRGQIADAPTAVSELWKNAYDAYARNVSLHIFDGDRRVGAIFDDGVGMSRDDIVNRWLVIGTESKLEAFDAGPVDTLGLPIRPRQGEKGIGRLSVAFLAPATVLISKRIDNPFVVVVVDWRLFENPYLALADIQLPVAEFETIDAALGALPLMIKTLRANLGGNRDARGRHLAENWVRFADYETGTGASLTTGGAIENLWNGPTPLTRRHIDEWDVAHGVSENGTAMFMIDLNHELAVWATPSSVGDEVDLVKEKLYFTLTAFTDPYSRKRVDFNYEVYSHVADTDKREVSSADIFDIEDLHELEHYIDGHFDERGTFAGRIVAFGQDLGAKTIEPDRPPSQRGKDKLGAFDFAIGTFEQDERRSTHEPNQHALLVKQAEKFAGVAVYRDELRVMPYGRPDADFLGMEERRSKHAGREFWAHRRTFGHVAFSRQENPALRDKAGREGLVDNRAFREMKLLIQQLLRETARKYFGTDSPLRDELMPGIMERKALQKEAADKARARRRRGMRQFLKEQSAPLDEAIQRAESLVALAKDTLSSKDRVQAAVLAARTQEMRGLSETLRPPVPPARMGDLEEQWRVYRDGYQAFLDRLQELAKLNAEVDASIQAEDPKVILKKRFGEQSKLLTSQLDSFGRSIDESLKKLGETWRQTQSEDKAELEKRVGHVLGAKINTANLIGYLNLVDTNRAELSEAFSAKYQAFLNTLEQLLEGLDLEGAYAATEDDRAELEARLQDIQAIAQIGITVEIVGHEFETLETEVRRNLSKLPASTRETVAFKQALRAHQALADRLRFLSPLKIAGYRSRETITGEQIAEFIDEFFSAMFREQRIEFTATKAFRGIAITDIPARLFPVFVNLVNNAVYWTAQSNKRRIMLDFQQGKAIVADTGPGVDIEDIPRLFTIFFSRRRMGRGVGLYLSRVNLAVAGHKIRYAAEGDPKVLPGANFIIEFKGVRNE
jgi:signal transduction histidine kinase